MNHLEGPSRESSYLGKKAPEKEDFGGAAKLGDGGEDKMKKI